MRWPWNRAERRAAPYTDAVVRTIQASASAASVAGADGTAALEFCAGMYARAFASADVSGPRAGALTPEVRAEIGRRVVGLGEAVYLIRVARGGLELLPVDAYDVAGGASERSRVYTVSVPAPDGAVTRSVASAGIVHVRWARHRTEPWRGIGPLQAARDTAALAGRMELKVSQEAGGPAGSVMPMPSDEESAIGQLREDLKGLKGRMSLVETTAAGYGEGRMAAPQSDWTQKRIGFSPPAPLVSLRDDASRSVLSACGVPPSLAMSSSDGTAQRESWRRFLHSAVQPLARIAEAELSAKLEADVRFSFAPLMASDLTGRARAYMSLVKAGMEAAEARRICGFD